MRQAIITKCLGPTNTRGTRIKATAAAGSVTVNWDYSLGMDANHARAAKVLVDKFEWGGRWIAGGAPKADGNVFVDVSEMHQVKGVDFFEGSAV